MHDLQKPFIEHITGENSSSELQVNVVASFSTRPLILMFAHCAFRCRLSYMAVFEMLVLKPKFAEEIE